MMRVAIVGGGLAGLAAAVALVERGHSVALYEARSRLGGRAGSYVDRATGEERDHCQHVALGCCTNFLDLCRRTGLDGLLARHRRLHFFGPDGRRYDLFATPGLPAPLHLAPAFLRIGYLSLREKVGIARAMVRLMRLDNNAEPGRSMRDWLAAQRQSPAAIERFWQIVLVSALAETLENVSVAAARKVFVDGFLAHRDAYELIIPRASLGELYDRRLAGWLRSRGAEIFLSTPVERLLVAPSAASDGGAAGQSANRARVTGLRTADGRELACEAAIVAVPWRRVADVLGAELAARLDLPTRLAALAGSPITSLHLCFDRAITPLEHAVLVGRLSQWVFERPWPAASRRAPGGPDPPAGHSYQVVISASRDLAGRERQEILDEVLADLAAVFPAARGARLLGWQLLTERDAVFSATPAAERARPEQGTAIPNLCLAGDWTTTGWPATMEGAVRSGYLAVEALLADGGRPELIVVPDRPRPWWL